MARKTRGEIVAGTYHVTLRSAGPIALFRDDVDRTDFCNRVADVIRRFRWACRAFCLLTTHYHLVVDVDENKLQAGMSRLNGGYAQSFNRRHGRSGHLCGERYHSIHVLTDGHMLAVIRYVARNPVEAGLYDHPADWLWSSYRGTAGLDAGVPFVSHELVLATFAADRTTAIVLLRAFVEDAA